MKEFKVIEKGSLEVDYGFQALYVICDHPKYGRILVNEAFGYINGQEGMVRWQHGSCHKILKSDTIESLFQVPHGTDDEERFSVLEIMMDGWGGDPTRPKIDLSKQQLENLGDKIDNFN